MTSLPVSTTRRTADTGHALRQRVDRSANRGLVLAVLGGLLLTGAGFLFLLFVFVAVDAFVPLPASVRWGGLIVLLVVTVFMGCTFAIRPVLCRKRALLAAEHIEQAAGAGDQPVIRGLTLRNTGEDDAITHALRERAEHRATQLVESVPPSRAYPASALRRQGRWVWLACVGWLVLAIVFPTQLLGVFTRALAPWVDAPPFSLTEMDPRWTPEPPAVGEDVTVTVDPTGVQPDGVDLLRLDEQGEVAERVPMSADGRGGFSHTLRRVDQPVRFKLEANGRATKAYTIEPTPREPQQPDPEAIANESDTHDDPGGTTQYDPAAVAERDDTRRAEMAALRGKIDRLLADLSNAEARAGAIDPADAAAMQDLAADIAELSKRAAALGDAIRALQADLPADVAASLDALQAALSQLQSAQLPPAPGGPSSEGGTASPAPADWLEHAQQATRNDQARIAQGVGASDLPTDDGTSSGNPGDDAPVFNDPRADGGYDEQGTTGDEGPLPPAVMQQVPPSYRAFITAYFNHLAEQDAEGEAGVQP